MSEVNYKALMANDVSIMNLSENEIFSSFIVIDQNNKQYYVGAYDLDHLSDFVNANEPVSDFSEFQNTLRNYFFSTASSESVPNTSNPDELLKFKHLNEFARQLNIKLDGGTDPKTARTISNVQIRIASGAYVTFSTDDGTNFTCDLNVSDIPNGLTYLRIASPNDFRNEYVFPTITGINYSSVALYAGNRFEIGVSLQKIAQVLKAEVSFRENNTLLAKTIKITINVTED